MLTVRLVFFLGFFSVFFSSQSVAQEKEPKKKWNSVKQEPGAENAKKVKGVTVAWHSDKLKNANDCSHAPCEYLIGGDPHNGNCPSYQIVVTLKNTNKHKVKYSVKSLEVEGTYTGGPKTYPAAERGSAAGIESFSGYLEPGQEYTHTYNECTFIVKSADKARAAAPLFASYTLKVKRSK